MSLAFSNFKLINVRTEHEEEEEFGTCEMCMYTAPDTGYYFEFRDTVTGEEFEVPGFHWEWGTKFEIEIDNIPRFAAWLQERWVPQPEYSHDYGWLEDRVLEYEEDNANPD